jgi:hypothetical protein
MWKNYFSQLLNVNRVNDVRQIGIHTAEPVAPEPSYLDAEVGIAKLKNNKSPGGDQIPAEIIQAGGKTSRSVIHKLINYIWSKEEFPDQ